MSRHGPRVTAVRAARRRARTRIAGLEAEALARLDGLSNQDLAEQLPVLAVELGHEVALRMAAARLSRPSPLASWYATVAEVAAVTPHLVSAAWAGLSPWGRGALICTALATGAAWWWG